MSTDYTIKTTNQPIYTTSEQKTSASDVSVWNTPRATESSSTNSLYLSSSTIKDIYRQYIREVVENYDGAKEQDVIKILSELGYSEENVIKLGKDAFYEIMPKFDNIFEHIYETSGDVKQKTENVIKQVKYNNGNLDVITDYNDNYNNADFKLLLKKIVNDQNLTIPEDIKKKLEKIEDIKELTTAELTCIVSIILQNIDNSDLNLEQLFKYLFLNIPDEYINENPILRDLLIGALEEASKNANFTSSDVFLTMFDKLKNTNDGLESALSDQMIENIFKTLSNSQNAGNFFEIAQSIIDSGNITQKQRFANSVGVYLSQQLAHRNELADKEEKTPEEQAFLDNFAKLEKLYEQAGGYALVRADIPVKQNLHDEAKKDKKFLRGMYEEAHKYSLRDNNVDPVKLIAELDEISGNEYSKVLTELGYELPTPENVSELREQAKNGTLISSDKEENSENGFGYSQMAQSNVDEAAQKAEILFSYIIPETSQETFTIDGKTENDKADQKLDIKPIKLLNISNLGSYTGEELKDLVRKKRIKFVDAVKQYSSKLLQSGKDYVVNELKHKSEGEQRYVLNQASNGPRYEIMREADLLDNENLNINFDTVHEQLRENYMA